MLPILYQQRKGGLEGWKQYRESQRIKEYNYLLSEPLSEIPVTHQPTNSLLSHL